MLKKSKAELDKIFVTTKKHEVPKELQPDMQRSKKLEWLTIAYLSSVVIIMYLTMSSSQAMKAAWTEDLLSLVPATVYLIAFSLYNKRPPGFKYPYGYHKIFTVAFLLGSFALLGIGLFVFYESLTSLIKQEHPTIGQIEIFGNMYWFGWVMMIALLYSFIPAIFLGRVKEPLAKKLHNKILYTDANTQKADWQTGAAAIFGIVGIGFGWWWADSAAAIFIAVNILKDGFKRTKESITDVIDQIPTKIDSSDTLPLVYELHLFFKQLDWVEDARIRLRENGQVLFGEVFIIPSTSVTNDNMLIQKIEQAYQNAKKIDWKVHDLTIQPVRSFDN